MPYSSEVRVWTATGDSPDMNVSLLLWELSTTIDNAGRVREQQVDQDNVTVAVSGGTTTPFSFVRGPDFLSNNNHSISLAAYQEGLPGPMFRSGRFETLPAGSPGDPNGLVDILLVDPVRIPMADINSMIGATLPMTLPDGNVINTVTVSSAPPSDTLTLVATGPYGATTYTYTLSFTITPSDDQVDLTSVLEANAVGSGSITFTANPGGGFQAFIDNLFAGLFVGRITSQVIADMTARLNTAAATAGASAAAGAGVPGGLPPGVILGARRVDIASNGDLVIFPAIGSLGSIINRFAAASPPGTTSRCFVATAVLDPEAVELSTLRRLRDERLLPTRAGRSVVAVYERLSPPLAAFVARRATLRALTRWLFVRPAYLLARRSLRRRP